MFIALLIIGVFFTIQTEGNFIAPRNLSNLLFQTVHIAILAVGMVLVIVAGHIDLSVGSIAGFTGAVAAILQVQFKMGTLPAVLITLLCGLLIGVWQGYWIAYRGGTGFYRHPGRNADLPRCRHRSDSRKIHCAAESEF